MRLLYIPMWSNKRTLAACSTWHWASRFFSYLVRAHDDVFVYFGVPDTHSAEEYAKIAHPRIGFVPLPVYSDIYREMLVIPDRLFYLFHDGPEGKYYVDAVICDRVLALLYARALLRCYAKSAGRSPIWVAVTQFLLDRYSSAAPPEYLEAQAFGLAAAELCLWPTSSMRGRGIETARLWGGLAAAERVAKSSAIGVWGIDTDAIDRAAEGIEKPRDVVIANWAYAMHVANRTEEAFRAVRQAIAVQNRFQVMVTSPSLGSGAIPDGVYQQGEVHLGLSQEEFWRKAARAHVFVYAPERNELSFSVLEQQWLGQVGVFLDRKMVTSQLYPGYPYLAQSWDQVPAMLIHLVEHWWDEDVQEVINKQRAFVESNYRLCDVAERVYERVEKLWWERVNASWRGRKGTVRQFYHERLDVYDHLAEGEWNTLIEGLTEFGIGPHRSGRYEQGRSMWRDLMLLEGWIDDCQEADPVFRKVQANA